MAKIIRLTESDLERIVKRVITESTTMQDFYEFCAEAGSRRTQAGGGWVAPHAEEFKPYIEQMSRLIQTGDAMQIKNAFNTAKNQGAAWCDFAYLMGIMGQNQRSGDDSTLCEMLEEKFSDADPQLKNQTIYALNAIFARPCETKLKSSVPKKKVVTKTTPIQKRKLTPIQRPLDTPKDKFEFPWKWH